MGPSSETAWNRARACDAHAKLTKDQNLRVKFERLRDSWIRIANEAEIASAPRKDGRGVDDRRRLKGAAR